MTVNHWAPVRAREWQLFTILQDGVIVTHQPHKLKIDSAILSPALVL